MVLRRFTPEGVEAFRQYLELLRRDPALAPPTGLLDDPAASEAIEPSITVTVRPFEHRMAFARWLDDATKKPGISLPRADVGFWAWLSLALFDQVCPADSKGHRRPGADARHIPDFSRWTRRYRHLLANPFEVYQLHRDAPERAWVVLANPLNRPGELTEQFTARLEIVQCPGTMALATYLYFDRSTGRSRRGAAGKTAGRFGKLMNQYTRTWDLPEIRTATFAGMLPREFDRFVSAAKTGDQL